MKEALEKTLFYFEIYDFLSASPFSFPKTELSCDFDFKLLV